MNAEQWNLLYPVGTPVTAYPVARPEDTESAWACERLVTWTVSKAWSMSHGQAVVSVEGYEGGIALTHVDPADALDQALDGVYQTARADADARETWHRERTQRHAEDLAEELTATLPPQMQAASVRFVYEAQEMA